MLRDKVKAIRDINPSEKIVCRVNKAIKIWSIGLKRGNPI